ncbi:helix-turn-helix transcriptional regulator [Staphylococcus saprophyticus]|nr:helix-turn-helix transcriptional regulator [Staphylococcus saprophyticus]
MIICTLKRYMELFEVNQSHLSEETGITRPTLLSLIKNENKNIKYENIDALCDFFGIGISDLLLYSPVPMKLTLSKWEKEEIDYPDDNDFKRKMTINEHDLIYNIDNQDFIFKGDIDPLDFEELMKSGYVDPMYVFYTCSISKEKYETLLKKGFTKSFFNYYNEIRDVRKSIVDDINNKFNTKLEEDQLNIEIEFFVKDSPDIYELKKSISYLPTDDLSELAEEIKFLLNKSN